MRGGSDELSHRMSWAWRMPQQYTGHSIFEYITNLFIWRFLSYIHIQNGTRYTVYTNTAIYKKRHKTIWKKENGNTENQKYKILILYGWDRIPRVTMHSKSTMTQKGESIVNNQPVTHSECSLRTLSTETQSLLSLSNKLWLDYNGHSNNGWDFNIQWFAVTSICSICCDLMGFQHLIQNMEYGSN